MEITKTNNGIKLAIRVIPGSSRCEIVGFIEKELKIKLDVPPVEGKANEKCVKYLSKQLGVPKTSISIISGEKSRSKLLSIAGDPDELEEKLASLIKNISDK